MIASWSRHRTAALVLVLAAAGSGGLRPALSSLEQARYRHGMLAALLRQPATAVQPAIAPDTVFRGDRRPAQVNLIGTVRDLATRERALIEQIAARPAPAPGLVAGHAVISGDVRTILRLIEAIESRTPAVRMPAYRLARNASGRSLRLDADLVMAFAP